MSTVKQDEARRANSMKSTGPRSEIGKQKSRLNAVKHGATGKLVLPTEDAEAYQARIDGIKSSLGSRTPLEEELAERAGQASWQLDRANRSEIARLTRNILTERAAAAAQEAEKIAAIGSRLFHDRRGPTALYPSLDYIQGQPQTSWSGLADDPDDPARLVEILESSLGGCRFLRTKWTAIENRVRSNEGVQSPDKLMIIRLIGHQPLHAADVTAVAEVFLACHAIEPQFEYPFQELRCEIHADLWKRYKDRLSRRDLAAITPPSATAARAVLLALVERATERLLTLEAAHQEDADMLDELQDDICSFDDTKGGEQLRRLVGSRNRLIHQNVEAVYKGRKNAGGGDGAGGGGGSGRKRNGRLLMRDENGVTRYVDDYEREKAMKARIAEAFDADGWAEDVRKQDVGRGPDGTVRNGGPYEEGAEDTCGQAEDIGVRTEDQDGTVRNGGPYEGAHPVGTTDLSGAIGNNGVSAAVDHVVWTATSETCGQADDGDPPGARDPRRTGEENEAEDVEQNEADAIRLTAEGDKTDQIIAREPVFQNEAEDIKRNEAEGERA